MPAQEVGEAFVAIRASAAGFAQQARQEVNAALAPVRESANVQIRAQVDQTGARAVQQSFQPVVAGARQMGSEVEKSYGTVGDSSHHAYERVQLSHDGIRARFGETLRAASAMGGGIALAYGAFSQVRQALTATNELAHSTNILTAATGLNARQASAWIAIAQAQGISSTQLQTSFNGLSRATDSAQQSFAKAAATQSDSLGKIHAEQLRVTSDQIAATDAVAKYGEGSRQAASAAATLASAQNTLQQYTSGATASLSTSADAFARLGITESQLRSVQGNLPAELSLIADKFQAMGAGTDRATIAQQLFGRGSSVLIPILAQGSAGIQKNIDVATQYGATLSGPTLRGMERLRVEQQQLSLEMEGLRVRIATALEPILISVGLVAIRVASQFGNVLAGGIRIAKGAMDAFLQTPYGQGLSTIAGDAIRFADQVRQHFQQTLERPLRFSRLFDSFKSDLLNWLPGATREFWTQLNSDLFAPGKEITVPIKGRITMQQEHGAQVPTQQLTGAGIFPGSGFEAQGKKLGGDIVTGVVDGLKALVNEGPTIGAFLQRALLIAVNFIAGHAADIARGGLIVANAFVSVLTSPQFWVQNWSLILNLAIALFPYDRLAVIPKNIIESLGLKGTVAALSERLGLNKIADAVRLLPVAVGVGISAAGDRLARGISDMFAYAATFATRDAGVVIRGVGDIAGRVAGAFVRVLGEAFGQGVPRVINTAFLDLTGTVDRAQAKLFDDVIGGFESNLLGKLFVRLVRFVTSSVITGEVEAAGLALYNSLWRPFIGALGPIPDLVKDLATMRTAVLGIAAVFTLAFGPVLTMWAIARGLALANAAADIIWTAATNAWAIATTAASVATRAWSVATAILNAVMDANPIILVGVAVVALGVAIYEAYRHSATFRNIVRELWDVLRGVGVPVLHAVEAAVRSFVNASINLWDRFGGTIKSVVRGAFDYVRGVIGAELGYIRSWINLIGDVLHGRWGSIWHDVENIVRNGLNVINHVLGGLPGDVVRIVREIGNRVAALGTWLFNEAKRLGGRLVDGILAGVKGLPGQLGDAIKGAASGAMHDATSFLHIGSPSGVFRDQLGTPINDGIVKGLDPLRSDLTSAIIPVMNRILNTAGTQGHSNGRSVGSGISTGITGGLSGLRAGLQTAIVSASNAAMAGAKKSLGISSPSRVYAEQIGKPLADGIIAGMGGLEQGLVKKVTAAAQAAQAASGGFGGSSTPSGSAAVGSNQALGRSMMLAHGWGADQWGALQALWTRESGWNQFAKNASSGAYGIPQSLPANKMASAGADYLTNPATQIRWGLDYIAARYGSPGGAWAHEESAGWYHGGGVVPGAPTQNVPIMARGGEVVFTPEQMKMLAGRGSVNVGSVNIFESQDGRQSARDFLAEIADRVR